MKHYRLCNHCGGRNRQTRRSCRYCGHDQRAINLSECQCVSCKRTRIDPPADSGDDSGSKPSGPKTGLAFWRRGGAA